MFAPKLEKSDKESLHQTRRVELAHVFDRYQAGKAKSNVIESNHKKWIKYVQSLL